MSKCKCRTPSGLPIHYLTQERVNCLLALAKLGGVATGAKLAQELDCCAATRYSHLQNLAHMGAITRTGRNNGTVYYLTEIGLELIKHWSIQLNPDQQKGE